MLSILGNRRRLCDGPTRREFLQVGAASLLGLNLPQVLALEARAHQTPTPMHGNGFGRAKSVIFLFLQGGPSHIDIWDPKPDAPDNVRGPFKPIPTNVPGTHLAETMPLLAQQMDKCTLVRSVSYTPNGLFNHTAAMYQMLTGYTALIAGGGITGGRLYGKSDETASSPTDSPVHPTQLLASVYHALGIDPATIVYNHLGQPRELVQAKVVSGLF